ncbi:hypothetical protein [Winogradskyella sp. J14-2]|uniref:hypothetical protein n=1 Tax=Winogradskyella sp. J14-2 TaxID=1936080 RepID=UPI0012FB9843|nr:hypothetical protein [Winogradskyella sp. J14-2]
MKTLKITLALVAVALLTLSGVESDKFETAEKSNVTQPTKIDLLAHGKKEIKLPTQG